MAARSGLQHRHYTDVDPSFGSMADHDSLKTGHIATNSKVILDLVPNHTSDQHPWFIESEASRDHPEGDWYIWRDPGPDRTRPIISFQNSAEARGNSNHPRSEVLLGVFQSNASLLTMAAISTVFASPVNFLSSPRTYRMHTSFCRRSACSKNAGLINGRRKTNVKGLPKPRVI